MAMNLQPHMYGSAGASRTTLIQISFDSDPIITDHIMLLLHYFIDISIILYQITKKCFH